MWPQYISRHLRHMRNVIIFKHLKTLYYSSKVREQRWSDVHIVQDEPVSKHEKETTVCYKWLLWKWPKPVSCFECDKSRMQWLETLWHLAVPKTIDFMPYLLKLFWNVTVYNSCPVLVCNLATYLSTYLCLTAVFQLNLDYWSLLVFLPYLFQKRTFGD